MRLTLDIDEREWWAWAIYYHLCHSGKFKRVEIYQTRKGHHIIAYGGAFNENDILRLRRHYGDDVIRVELDSIKYPEQVRQVLWTKKDGYEVKLLEEHVCDGL